jgi:hypothetical protein
MLAAQSATHDLGSAQLLLVVASILIVLFWRIALKMVLIVVAIAMIILVTSGLAAVLQDLHHLIK